MLAFGCLARLKNSEVNFNLLRLNAKAYARTHLRGGNWRRATTD